MPTAESPSPARARVGKRNAPSRVTGPRPAHHREHDEDDELDERQAGYARHGVDHHDSDAGADRWATMPHSWGRSRDSGKPHLVRVAAISIALMTRSTGDLTLPHSNTCGGSHQWRGKLHAHSAGRMVKSIHLVRPQLGALQLISRGTEGLGAEGSRSRGAPWSPLKPCVRAKYHWHPSTCGKARCAATSASSTLGPRDPS